MNRRRFLGAIGASSALALCRPELRAGTHSGSLPSGLRDLAGLPERQNLMLGYPINMATPPEAFFAWREELAKTGLNRFAYNNVGNPYEHSHIPFNTHHFEREIIARFGAIYKFPPDDTWGFLTNSGTDSNLHGLYFGRTILKGRTGVAPKIYFTKEAHYSVQILRDLLGIEWIEVGTHPDGRMDEADLERRLSENPDYPALVCVTVGTTFKGSVDSIDAIQEKLKSRPSYLHVDAALFGGYLPHTRFAGELHQTVAGKQRYDSIAVSCHKFFGFASPAGLFVITRTNFEAFHSLFSEVHDPEYILQVPGTITCSRDSVKPAEFHFFSTDKALKRQAADTRRVMENTRYLLDNLERHLPQMDPVLANPMSNTVYFRKPSDVVVDRYSLATMTVERKGRPRPYAHIVVMPHVNKPIIDRFLEDIG